MLQNWSLCHHRLPNFSASYTRTDSNLVFLASGWAQETPHCREVSVQIAEKRFQSLWKGDVFTRLLSERTETTERFTGGDKSVRGVATRVSWEADTEWRWDFKRGRGWCSLNRYRLGHCGSYKWVGILESQRGSDWLSKVEEESWTKADKKKKMSQYSFEGLSSKFFRKIEMKKELAYSAIFFSVLRHFILSVIAPILAIAIYWTRRGAQSQKWWCIGPHKCIKCLIYRDSDSLSCQVADGPRFRPPDWWEEPTPCSIEEIIMCPYEKKSIIQVLTQHIGSMSFV